MKKTEYENYHEAIFVREMTIPSLESYHSGGETERFWPLTPSKELQVCALLCKYGGKALCRESGEITRMYFV